MEEKLSKKLEILHKRNEERLLDIEKEKEDKKQINAENEKIDYFVKVFSEKQQEIEDAIRKADYLPKLELANHFDAISKNILMLQKHVANSNIFLRGYDIKVFQKHLLELTNEAKNREEMLLPKKKFGFKKKVKAKPEANNVVGLAKTEVDHVKLISIPLNENSYGFGNKSNEKLILNDLEMHRKDVDLNNLTNCKILLFGAPSTLHMTYLKNCYVFCGPVSTSIFAENCKNCTFVIACQQLRLHSSENINIYIHVTSRAIMEDCNQIHIAPYNLKYDGIENDFQKSGLDMSINNWKCVDDFNWLNIEKASPNWSTIAADNRIDNWNDFTCSI